MAKLEGVTYMDIGVVGYEGEAYRKTDETPVPGDIVYDGSEYFVVVRDTTGEKESDAYDGVSVMRDFGEAFVRKSFAIFRKSDQTADILATKRTQLASLTAEITQLEAQLAEESRLKVGDYARVIVGAEEGRFEPGDVVTVSRIARAESAIYPIGAVSPLLGYAAYEAYKPEHLTKITPEEARASLIEKIDAHFGGQEAK